LKGSIGSFAREKGSNIRQLLVLSLNHQQRAIAVSQNFQLPRRMKSLCSQLWNFNLLFLLTTP